MAGGPIGIELWVVKTHQAMDHIWSTHDGFSWVGRLFSSFANSYNAVVVLLLFFVCFVVVVICVCLLLFCLLVFLLFMICVCLLGFLCV